MYDQIDLLQFPALSSSLISKGEKHKSYIISLNQQFSSYVGILNAKIITANLPLIEAELTNYS